MTISPKPPSALRDFSNLRAPGGRGVYASTGHLFRDAIFGRDSIEVAEDLLETDPALALEVIRLLARLQGTVDVPAGPRSTEEQRGRIHHEERQRVIDGRTVDPECAALIAVLSAKWGGTPDAMTYYASVDATPLFVRLVDRYCAATGSTAILDESIVNKDGQATTLRESALAAAQWVVRTIEQSVASGGPGVLEYQRRNPRGLEYQCWRDGRMSMLHPAKEASASRSPLPHPRPFEACGELVNPDEPMATIESQGVAYDALLAAARMTPDATEAHHFTALAQTLRTNVFREFWMPREQYFATALDRDAGGSVRQVSTLTASAAELLDTGIFDGLDGLTYKRYVANIVRHITGPDFITAAGVRTTSLRHRDQLDHVAYQGPFTVWHKQTYDIAKGLRRQGFERLALQFENRLLNATNASGRNYEFLYVDGRGRVALDSANRRAVRNPDVIVATNSPDKGQAWTVSAVLATKRRRGRAVLTPIAQDPFVRRLEVAAMAHMPAVAVVTSRQRLAAIYQSSHPFIVDRVLGEWRQSAFTSAAAARWAAASGGVTPARHTPGVTRDGAANPPRDLGLTG